MVWSGVVVGVICFLFSNSLHNEFAFDDGYAITGNEDVTGVAPWTKLWINDFWGQDIASEGSHKSYRPITTLSFRLNSLLHYYMENVAWYEEFCTSTLNKNPLQPPERPLLRSEFFHIANITLHTIVTLLVGNFLSRMCNVAQMKPILGFLPVWFVGALLFAIHPVHVEAVTGIVGRAELLCGLWMLVGLNIWSSFVLYPSTQSVFFKIFIFIICTLCFILSVLSKETGFALGVLYVAFMFIWNMRSVLEAFIPYKYFQQSTFLLSTIYWGVLSIGYILFRQWLTVHMTVLINRQLENPVAFIEEFGFRAVSSMYIHWRYFWLLVFPNELCCDYSMNCIPMINSWSDVRLLLPIGLYTLLVVAAVGGLVAFQRCTEEESKKSMKIYFFSWTILVLTFLPASNIFIYVGTLIGERLLYLPSIGFCYLFALGWKYVDTKLSSRFLRVTLCLLVVCYFIFLGYQTYERNFDWENEETLFRSAERVCPDSAKVQENLGVLERRYQNYEKAMAHFNRGKEIWPPFCDIDYWKGLTQINMGKIKDGIDTLLSILHCRHAQTNTVMALKTLFDAAHEGSPNNPEMWVWWADALLELGLYESALPVYSAAGRIHIDIGASLLTSNKKLARDNFRVACQYLDSALAITPEHDKETKCTTSLMKGICETQLGGSPHRIAEYYLVANSCPDTFAHSVSGILNIQKQHPEDPLLHEYWADAVCQMDQLQAFRHYNACAMLLIDKGKIPESLPCVKKLLYLHQQNEEIRKDFDVTVLNNLLQNYS